MAQSGFHGEKFRELLHLQDTPSSLITRSVRGVEVAATETRDDNPVPGLCSAIVPEDAYIVSLKLRDYPDCEYWERGKCVTKPNIRAGTTYLYDMKCDPRFVIDKPFHSLHFYVPALALDGIAEQSGVRRVGQLDCQFGTGFHDEVVHHIGASLLQGLRRPSEANQLFVDHMMLALTAHVAQAYGGLRPGSRPARGGLAPWQAKRACEKLEFGPRRKTFTATNRGRVRPLGQPFFTRVSNLHRPAAAPMAASPAREGGQAVDDRARPAAVRDCDIGRVCQSKPLYAGVLGRGRRQPGRLAPRRLRASRKARRDPWDTAACLRTASVERDGTCLASAGCARAR